MSGDLQVRQEGERLVVESPMRWGKRVFFAVGAMVPLLAPWQLLIQPRWHTYWHPFFFFAAAVSLGAVAVSALLFFAAFAGLASRMSFDPRARTFTASRWAPLVPRRTYVYPLGEVRTVQVVTHEWTEGPPSFSLQVETADGRKHRTNSVAERASVEALLERVEAMRAAA